MNKVSIKNSKAFTLIELVIALLVFLIGVLGVLQLLALTINFNQRNRDISLCTALAQAKADELLQYTFIKGRTDPNLDRGGVIPTIPYNNPLRSPNPAPVGGFSDFYTLQGVLLTKANAVKGAAQTVPDGRYYVVQWQICDACESGQPTLCTAVVSGSPVCTGTDRNILKKITVTVTAMSPLLGRSLPTATVVVYRSRLN
jgi:prepilin-type N-terminal cleavage/methylation domain-containing protein